MKSQKRNLNPTPEARVAMWLYSKEYVEYGGGSMDFWDSLKESAKDQCRQMYKDVLEAHKVHSVNYKINTF
jgi:hypothetical protein